jgi:F420 biosynthesis protein FbiB-like protein
MNDTKAIGAGHLADEVARIIKGRRSVRTYQQRPVSQEQILHLLEAARWAPSPHGRQPWRFAVITDFDVRQRLAYAMGEHWLAQLQADQATAQAAEARLQKSYQRIENAPVVIIPCLSMVEMDEYPDEQRRSNEYMMAVQSLGCAVQNILLMAYSMGLDCGWMCAPLFCPDAVCATLKLDASLEPHALITAGYAAEDPVRRSRRSLEDLLVFWQ